jgi:molecular chaperone GrpE
VTEQDLNQDVQPNAQGEEGKAESRAPEKSADETGRQEAQKQEDFYNQLLRLKAEFENYRKRTDREKQEWYKQGKSDSIAKLLPLYDVLRQAHQDIAKSHEGSPAAKGMEMIFKEFEKLFKDEGVTVMDAAGKPLDPLKHEVLGAVKKDGADEGSVADVLQDGYMQGDRVLRTAKVRIVRNK